VKIGEKAIEKTIFHLEIVLFILQKMTTKKTNQSKRLRKV